MHGKEGCDRIIESSADARQLTYLDSVKRCGLSGLRVHEMPLLVVRFVDLLAEDSCALRFVIYGAIACPCWGKTSSCWSSFGGFATMDTSSCARPWRGGSDVFRRRHLGETNWKQQD